jgi:hypothetical protein
MERILCHNESEKTDSDFVGYVYPAESGSGTLTALMQCTALQSANSRSLCNADSESLLVIAFP